MILQKDGGQVGKTISNYSAFLDPVKRDKILEEFFRDVQVYLYHHRNHSNITTVHEIDDWHGQDFIYMKHVDGETEKEIVKNIGTKRSSLLLINVVIEIAIFMKRCCMK